jgi:hypothetical protein
MTTAVHATPADAEASQLTALHECYGHAVLCSYPPDAQSVVRESFGSCIASARTLAIRTPLRFHFQISEQTGGSALEPAHNPSVLMSDPIVVETGTSCAVLDVHAGSAVITLSRSDLESPLIWGRWILERLFVYIVCRSRSHYPLHAGALVIDGRSVVVSAAAGVGKSTFVFAAVERGALLSGEDILVRHMDSADRRLWGYPRALYVAPEWLEHSVAFRAARRVAVPGAHKDRVTIPPALEAKLRPGVEPDCFVFLTRGPAGTAPVALTASESVERSRADFSVAKQGDDLLRAESDLHALLDGRASWEFAVSDDLDESYRRLREALRVLAPSVRA